MRKGTEKKERKRREGVKGKRKRERERKEGR